MRIAITGASGHIGNNLSRALVKEGHQLRLMVNRRTNGLEQLDAELFRCNLQHVDQVKAFVAGMDIVIHTAAKISIGNYDEQSVWDTNVLGTQNIVEACVANKIKRLLHFSSIHVFDPKPIDAPLDEKRPLLRKGGAVYDQSKVKAEDLVLAAVDNGLDAIILNPTSVFGPNDYYPSLLGQGITDFYKGKIPALMPGGYNFVFVQDVVKATLSALEKGKKGERYILSGRYLSIVELTKAIIKAGGKPKRRPILPTFLLKLLIPFFTIQSKIQKQPPLLTTGALKILTEGPKDIRSTKAENELGYSTTPFETALDETITWFKKNGQL